MIDRFAHHLRLDQLRDGERLNLVADEAERRSIADRLGISALDRFEAHVTLSFTGASIRAEGRIAATLKQSCVVTGEPVNAHVDEPFALMFTPEVEPERATADDEIELGAQDCDVVFYEGASIDLGSAVADTLALSIDPYPRSAGADAVLKEAGIMSQEQASPFAVLAKLKKTNS